MNSRYTTVGVAVRLLLQAVCISVASIGFYTGAWEYGLIALVVAGIAAGTLVYFVNGVHRKLHFFFDAVRNGDHSIRFPEKVSDKTLKGLHENLNRVNRMLADIRTRQEHSERFFLEFMKRSATGIIAVDSGGFIEIANDAALKLTGLKNLTHLDRMAQHNRALFELMQGLQPGQSATIKIPDGPQLRQVSVKMAALQFAEKKFRLFSLYDVRAEMEENELETWQKLIRIMTHEIMNSIAPITSISQTVLGYYNGHGKPVGAAQLDQQKIEDTLAGLKVIEERAAGLLKFVEDYRQLTRIPRPVFRSIDLEGWLASIRLLFESKRAEEDIQLTTENRFHKPDFPGDEKLLTHVMLNLLNNASDAMKDCPDKKLEIIAEKGEAGTLRLKVRDNGKGFREEERDQLFLPFYTTKEDGSGIGLSLSRQIVRLHRGSISATSVPGKGAEFVVEV